MLQEDERYVRWVAKSRRAGVTLGQLAALLELIGSASVAELSGAKISRAVNYRQKLARLEGGLAIGPLTERVNGSTRLNRAGEQVAGELRLLLRELVELEASGASTCRWTIGAGDAWLQSVIVPALGAIPGLSGACVWDVNNLRASEITRGLKEGRLHFGFMRAADLKAGNQLAIRRTYSGTGLELMVGHASAAPTKARELLAWLTKNNRRFIQQGSTWVPLREQLIAASPLRPLLQNREPEVICELHMQAATAAAQSGSWCVVPTKIAELFSGNGLRRVELLPPGAQEDMVLVVNARNHDKLPHLEAATRTLVTAIDSLIERNSRKGANKSSGLTF